MTAEGEPWPFGSVAITDVVYQGAGIFGGEDSRWPARLGDPPRTGLSGPSPDVIVVRVRSRPGGCGWSI